MKKLILIIAILVGATSFAQVGIGTTAPTGVLDLVSTDGALVIPRVANVGVVVNQETNGTPVAGSMVYDISQSCIRAFNGSTWSACFGAGAGATPARVTNVGTLTDADLNGFVVTTVNVTFDLSTLNPSNGDTITLVDANSAGSVFSVIGINTTSTAASPAPGGGLSYIYVASTDSWYSYSSF